MAPIRHIDQSRKFEQTSGDTIIACANDVQCSIRIPANVKRAIIRVETERGRKLKQIVVACFAAGVFLVLRECGSSERRVILDREYDGHERTIKAMIIRHFQKAGLRIKPEMIAFGLVGKSSAAHQLAWQVYRGRKKANRTISQDELLSLVTR